MMNIIDKSRSHTLNINPLLYWLDSYKASHILFETEGVKEIYSNFTPRFDKYLREMLGNYYDGKYVVFGIQWMVLRLHHMMNKGFFERPKAEVISEMKAVLGPYIGQEKFDHFEVLHDLGYLPIKIKALDEGTVVPVGVPFFTIRNTHPDFEWLPNYLETGISTDLWKQLTVATVARIYRMISNDYALKTTGTIEGTEWQNHDFHSRGASGFESCAISGAAFLTSSCGTDNLAALWAAENFYGSTNDNGLLAGSVPAGEHSVTTSGILTEQMRRGTDLDESEYEYSKKIMKERFPTGIVSYVADSYDYWEFVDNILPQLSPELEARDGKFVVRGDSGNPVHVIAGYRIATIDTYSEAFVGLSNAKVTELIHDKARKYFENGYEAICINREDYHRLVKQDGIVGLVQITQAEAEGTIETLYRVFGGTENELGYKLLNPKVGMIYGDGITVQRSEEILKRLEEKYFASTNIVFGVGSYSLNMLSRDHLGMAIKATNTIVDINGKLHDMPIYKDPKTDSSKKSAKGLIKVYEADGKIGFIDNCTRQQEGEGLLTTVYEDGLVQKTTTLFEIRDRIWK